MSWVFVGKVIHWYIEGHKKGLRFSYEKPKPKKPKGFATKLKVLRQFSAVILKAENRLGLPDEKPKSESFKEFGYKAETFS